MATRIDTTFHFVFQIEEPFWRVHAEALLELEEAEVNFPPFEREPLHLGGLLELRKKQSAVDVSPMAMRVIVPDLEAVPDLLQHVSELVIEPKLPDPRDRQRLGSIDARRCVPDPKDLAQDVISVPAYRVADAEAQAELKLSEAAHDPADDRRFGFAAVECRDKHVRGNTVCRDRVQEDFAVEQSPTHHIRPRLSEPGSRIDEGGARLMGIGKPNSCSMAFPTGILTVSPRRRAAARRRQRAMCLASTGSCGHPQSGNSSATGILTVSLRRHAAARRRQRAMCLASTGSCGHPQSGNSSPPALECAIVSAAILPHRLHRPRALTPTPSRRKRQSQTDFFSRLSRARFRCRPVSGGGEPVERLPQLDHEPHFFRDATRLVTVSRLF